MPSRTRLPRAQAQSRTPQSRNRLDPETWLAQFAPADEAALGTIQRHFVNALRRQFPQGQVGNRKDNGCLCFYAADPVLGFFAGLVPAEPG